MAHTVVVVPCYDEAERLAVEPYRAFAEHAPGYRFLFVNDGSRDATGSVLQGFRDSDPGTFGVLSLAQNAGKAEAVRQGFLEAFRGGPEHVAFLDADLATPVDALARLRGVLVEKPELDAVFGSRVQLLGRDIDRHAWRHYLGRVFATVVSTMLRIAVYDTQCGAKMFRRSPRIERVFAEPFLSRWVFDVEIIARLDDLRLAAGEPGAEHAIYEIPLDRWTDVGGSKVKATDFLRASLDVLRIHRARPYLAAE